MKYLTVILIIGLFIALAFSEDIARIIPGAACAHSTAERGESYLASNNTPAPAGLFLDLATRWGWPRNMSWNWPRFAMLFCLGVVIYVVGWWDGRHPKTKHGKG